ncbi:MAG: glycosyltransferase family 2 protein [Acidimicrobiales bacterium]
MSGSTGSAPSVSVIIATRDRPEMLRRALDGIAAQDHDGPLEVIVVYDRTDPDLNLTLDHPRFTLRVCGNDRAGGLAGARNTGILASTADWIAFCDDDDEWLPGKLAAQFAALDATPGAVAACTGILIRYEGADTARVPAADRLSFDGFLRDRMTEVHPSSWLVDRAALVDRIGLVDEELPGSYAEDYDLFLRTSAVGAIAVAPEPLVRVWWHGSSFFFERWRTIDDALGYLLEKYPEFADEPRGLARIEGQRAVAQAAMGHRRRALGTVWRTLRLNPVERRVPVALVVAAGVPAGAVLAAAHRFGKGI